MVEMGLRDTHATGAGFRTFPITRPAFGGLGAGITGVGGFGGTRAVDRGRGGSTGRLVVGLGNGAGSQTFRRTDRNGHGKPPRAAREKPWEARRASGRSVETDQGVVEPWKSRRALPASTFAWPFGRDPSRVRLSSPGCRLPATPRFLSGRRASGPPRTETGFDSRRVVNRLALRNLQDQSTLEMAVRLAALHITFVVFPSFRRHLTVK